MFPRLEFEKWSKMHDDRLSSDGFSRGFPFTALIIAQVGARHNLASIEAIIKTVEPFRWPKNKVIDT